jgi:enoyl-CoA hydratase/carnithine racemase
VPQNEGRLIVERLGHVLVLTLNRPERLNSLDRATGRALKDSLREADADPEVLAIVLTGRGRAFCAGGDLKEMAAQSVVGGQGMRVVSDAITTRPLKPLIAAVNGLAYGGGFELTLGCDLVIAARSASFALPETTRGVLASAGGLVRLPAIVGVRRALQLSLTGLPIDAETALAWGLVNEVVADEELRDSALGLAMQIAANAPLSVAASKAVVYEADGLPEAEGFRVNDVHHAEVARSSDAHEGPRAFSEKRAPIWIGR